MASLWSFGLPLAALWRDAVPLAAVWPACVPRVVMWRPAQHDLAAVWSSCLHLAATAFHAAASRRNGCRLADAPSSRRYVAAGALRRWLRSGHRRFASFGLLSESHFMPGGRGLTSTTAAGTAAGPATVVGTPSLAEARCRTIKYELTHQFRL